MRILGAAGSLFFFAAATLTAQHDHGKALAPPEIRHDLGNHHHAIATKSPEAQQFFDQGLILLYGFNHDEAARYFRRAAELDPASPMPWWGLALSIGPNYNDTAVDENRAKATYEAVQNALRRATNGTSIEQDYVRALAKRCATPCRERRSMRPCRAAAPSVTSRAKSWTSPPPD